MDPLYGGRLRLHPRGRVHPRLFKLVSCTRRTALSYSSADVDSPPRPQSRITPSSICVWIKIPARHDRHPQTTDPTHHLPQQMDVVAAWCRILFEGRLLGLGLRDAPGSIGVDCRPRRLQRIAPPPPRSLLGWRRPAHAPPLILPGTQAPAIQTWEISVWRRAGPSSDAEKLFEFWWCGNTKGETRYDSIVSLRFKTKFFVRNF